LSKISEQLSKLGHVERSGFGFGTKSVSTKIPVILVGVEEAELGKVAQKSVDFAILSNLPKELTGDCKSDIDIPVGVSVTAKTEVEIIFESQVDFVVIAADDAPGSALKDNELGKGYVVQGELNEDRAKAVDSGPFDFVVVDGTNLSLPLSVGEAFSLQETIQPYSRHIALRVATAPGKDDLELLRDMGVSALLFASGISESTLSELREKIDQIEPRKSRNNASAVIPSINDRSGARPGDVEPDHDHDHDEDDDWE
jgi:hypothetical protein